MEENGKTDVFDREIPRGLPNRLSLKGDKLTNRQDQQWDRSSRVTASCRKICTTSRFTEVDASRNALAHILNPLPFSLFAQAMDSGAPPPPCVADELPAVSGQRPSTYAAGTPTLDGAAPPMPVMEPSSAPQDAANRFCLNPVDASEAFDANVKLATLPSSSRAFSKPSQVSNPGAVSAPLPLSAPPSQPSLLAPPVTEPRRRGWPQKRPAPIDDCSASSASASDTNWQTVVALRCINDHQWRAASSSNAL